MAGQEPSSGGDRWVLSGDLRLRGEYDVDRTALPNRARPRVRFRVGLEHSLVSRVYVGARLVTAPSAADPNSTHQTVGLGFQAYRVALDRAYVRWEVPIDGELSIRAGKFGHPFTNGIVYDELVWDADVQPDGVAAVYRPTGAVRIVAGEYLVLHRSPGTSVGLTAAQAAWTGRIAGSVTAGTAVGVFAYGRPDEEGARVLARENQGNALITAATGDTLAFASDFDLVHLIGWLRYSPGPLRLAVGGQYVANTSAATGLDDDGFAVAAELGSPDRMGSWLVHYQYQRMDQEAVFSPFAQDDFLDATNFRGHLMGVSVRARSGITVHLWTLWSARRRPPVDTLQKRFRLDLNLTF